MQTSLISLAGSVSEYDGDAVKLQYFMLFIRNYKTLVFWVLVGFFVCLFWGFDVVFSSLLWKTTKVINSS